MNRLWEPSWSDDEIKNVPPNVGKSLRNGLYSDKINKAQSQCKGKSWWDRQFNITARAACSSLKVFDKKIETYKNDAPRVLGLVRNQWQKYSQLVMSQHGSKILDKIIEFAKEGPAEFYVYLVTVHIQKPFFIHKPGYEDSVHSSWSKIGRDNQFLWPINEFKKVFI